MEFKILGVKISNVYLAEVIESIEMFLRGKKGHYIVTTNPEFIMAARKDKEFKEILNNADLSVADGMGIKFAAKRYGETLKQRLTGVDLLWEIIKIAEREGRSIFLLGSKHGIPEKTARLIKQKYPNLRIAGAECGYRRWHRPMKDHKLVDMINRRQPDILFVAFGQVKQEKWIHRNLPKLVTVKLAMGVGGSFDYISKTVRRAPRWMRGLGLEWLFRLLRQPWRLPRIINAVIRFSWIVLRNK